MLLENLICAEAQNIHNIFREFGSIKIYLCLQNYNSILQSGLTRQNIIMHFYIWFYRCRRKYYFKDNYVQK